jgi:uncharacterized PurR-regulated membrane protein YhhQ (DUF165 family)
MPQISKYLLTAWSYIKQAPVWWLIGLCGVVVGSAVATIVTYDICGCAL